MTAASAEVGAVPDEAEEAPVAEAPKITVEVTIIELSEEQEARFGGNIEWLYVETGDFFTEANPAGVDAGTSRRRCASPSSALTIPMRTISSATPSTRAA